MKKPELTRTFITPILEILAVGWAFSFSYYLRGITDGIPFVQLRIPAISYEQFFPFILSGIILWIFIFGVKWLYDIRDSTPFIEEIRLVITYSFFWFIFYISFVYLSTGFLFKKEIPRLIIIYVYILSTLLSLLIRTIRHNIFVYLYKKNYLQKRKILAIGTNNETEKILINDPTTDLILLDIWEKEKMKEYMRKREIDTILSLKHTDIKNLEEIIELARVYGISFVYPKIIPEAQNFTPRERLLWDMPVVEVTAVSISAWERILKRTIDIIGSIFGLILLLPILGIIALGIKIEDPSWPIIFRNRRIGKDGKMFDLYKFRYMYWKYSVKDAYGVVKKNDDALKFEEELKQKSDTRKWPLYKIENDPRKMQFWKLIEKLSLDELPQLWNVLKWDMSLIGPRPHQPREVEQYAELDHQVLTIKPGITGMAQVYGRDTNSWEEEVIRDRYYIEHYSITLDFAILLRTFFVVVMRMFK